MFERFFELWPAPSQPPAKSKIMALLRPLGFGNKRLETLARLTRDWLAGVPPERIHGVGRYGLDAYAIFVEGRLDVKPQDHFLRPYLAWRKRHGRSE